MADSKNDPAGKKIDFMTALQILTGMSKEELKKTGIKPSANVSRFRRNFTAFTDPTKNGRVECVILVEAS